MDKKTLAKLQKAELDIMQFVCDFCDEHNITYYLVEGTLLGAIRHDGFIPWDDDIDIAMPRKDFDKFQSIFKDTDDYELDSYHTDKYYYLPFIKIRAKNTECIQANQRKYLGKKGIWIDVFPLDNASRFKMIDKIRFRATDVIKQAMRKKMGASIGSTTTIKGYILCLVAKLPKTILISSQHMIMTRGSSKSENIVNLGSTYGIDRERYPRNWFFPASTHVFCGQSCSVPNNYCGVLSRTYGSNYMTPPPNGDRATHNLYKIKFNEHENGHK